LSLTLFINAKVWQPDGSFYESFGVKDNHFDFSGSNEQAKSISDEYDEVIDLKNKLVLPGIIDGHLHLVYGSQMRKRLDCSSVKNLSTLKQTLEKYSQANPKKEWLIGSNLNLSLVASEMNSADEIYSDKPLFIANYDYHSAIANNLAFKLSGLSEKLNEFNDEQIVKDINGQPNGIIKEEALDFVFERLPKATLDEKCKDVEDMIRVFHSYGITQVTDITQPEDLEVYKQLYETGKLKIRINSYLPFEEFENLKSHEKFTEAIDKDLFSIKGFKSYYDGALGSESALFSENYFGRNHNGQRTDFAEKGLLQKLAKEIDKHGYQIIIHAIGDKAVTEVLDLCEEIENENGKCDRRTRIEHAQHIQEKDFERFKRLNVIASVQPIHLKYDISTVQKKLPQSIVNITHNYKHLIINGCTVNFGTDFPIVGVNPFKNIQLAVTRKSDCETFLPDLKIDLHNCIKAYTINNAYSNFNENACGKIYVDKVSDFVIMEDDLFKMNPDDLGKAKVWKTYFNGEEVYSNSY